MSRKSRTRTTARTPRPERFSSSSREQATQSGGWARARSGRMTLHGTPNCYTPHGLTACRMKPSDIPMGAYASSGSNGNCTACAGIPTPGTLREVQICTAPPRSGGSSSDPPLMLSVSVLPRCWCQRREPQSIQNMQSSIWPLFVGRDQSLGVPLIKRNPDCRTTSEIPKADADCLRHSPQWQT